jgi:hypothetical protein
MSYYTDKKEKEEFGNLLTKYLKKHYSFIKGVEVSELKLQGIGVDIECFIMVEKEFILENIKLDCTSGFLSKGELKKYISIGEVPTFAFNICSKNIQFKTKEFMKLVGLLFHSMFQQESQFVSYSVVFKLI